MAYEIPQLGDRVRDPVTSFEGIVMVIATWLHGCVRVGVQPEKLGKDGKPQEDRHFDQSQLVVVKKGVHQAVVLQAGPAPVETRRGTGGPARETSGYKR